MMNRTEYEIALASAVQQPALMSTTVRTTGSTQRVNSFQGGPVQNGAVLLGYKNDAAWCTVMTEEFCHTGLWDEAAWRYGRRDDRTMAIRSANTGNGSQAVYLETPNKWQLGYQSVAELKVSGADSPAARTQAVRQAATYQGTFNFFTSKASNSKWYCAKVAWRAYSDTTGVDIDGDGGFWVFPNDIWASSKTVLVRWWA